MGPDDVEARPSARSPGNSVSPAWFVALTLTIFAAERLGQGLNFGLGLVAPLWPASGIAIAGIFLLGRRYWPAVFLAGILAGALAGRPALVWFTQGLASTAEALLGVALLRRFDFRPSLERVRDVLVLLVGGALVAPIPAALIGTAGLLIADLVPPPRTVFGAGLWWFGDALGVLVFAPAVLVPAARVSWRGSGAETAALAVATTALCGLLFTPLGGHFNHLPLTFAISPLLLWASLRFGIPGAVATIVVVTLFATLGTLSHEGPFSSGAVLARLVLVQVFVGVQALVALFLAAADGERRAAIHLRDEFLSIASHELKTPLTPMKVSLQLLRTRGPSPGLLDRALRQLDRLTLLIDSLLDVSRIGAGKLVLDLEELDLAALAREVAERLAPQAASSGCRLEIEARGPVIGRWDRMRLEQVLGNLLTNAFKYAAGEPVRLVVEGSGATARVVVEDEGGGIPPEDIDRIFERFERGRAGATVAGLGLGLYISRQIVEALGGTLVARPRPGRGATFRIELPRGRSTLPPSARVHRLEPV